MRKYKVAIIGGGAAGGACAARLTQLNCGDGTIILEKGERLGKKLAATGNGQGNVTNVNMSAEHYFGGGKHLAEKISCGDYSKALGLFCNLFSADESGRVYPSGRQAAALCDSLVNCAIRGGVEIKTGCGVSAVDKGFVITTDRGEKISADCVVLCTGGKAQKQFKTDGSAYALAQKFGHKITALYPSLVQLKTDTEYIRTLKGIRADCIVTAKSFGKLLKTVRGDVIFTDYGVSGNAIFSLSPYVTDRQNCKLSLQFLPDIPESEIIKIISERKRLGYPESELLGGTLHNQLGRAIIRRSGGADPEKIAKLVKDFTLDITGSLGFDYAQVTRGGVSADEVSDNLESKLQKNLFFAGEILDVDGDCGGYNLHWAFTSGMAVAEEIAKRL